MVDIKLKLYNNSALNVNLSDLKAIVEECLSKVTLNTGIIHSICFTDSIIKAEIELCPDIGYDKDILTNAQGTTVYYNNKFYIFMDIIKWKDTSYLSWEVRERLNRHNLVHELGHVIIDTQYNDLFDEMDRLQSQYSDMNIYLGKLFIKEFNSELLAQLNYDLSIPSIKKNFNNYSKRYSILKANIDELAKKSIIVDEKTKQRLQEISIETTLLSKKIIYDFAMLLAIEKAENILHKRNIKIKIFNDLEIIDELKSELIKLEEIFNSYNNDMNKLAFMLVKDIGNIYMNLRSYILMKFS